MNDILAVNLQHTGNMLKSFDIVEDFNKEVRYAQAEMPDNFRDWKLHFLNTDDTVALGLHASTLSIVLLNCSTIVDIQRKVAILKERGIPPQDWKAKLINFEIGITIPTTRVEDCVRLASLDPISFNTLGTVGLRIMDYACKSNMHFSTTLLVELARVASASRNVKLLIWLSNFVDNRYCFHIIVLTVVCLCCYTITDCAVHLYVCVCVCLRLHCCHRQSGR